MLSFFRRGGTGQILVGAIVFAIIIVFVLEFRAGGKAEGAALDVDCAVEVRDDCVDKKDYYAAYGLVVPRGAPQKQVRKMGLPEKVLAGLAERELLVDEADRLGISISEQEIDDELAKGRAHVSLPAEDATWLSFSLGLCIPDRFGQRCAPGTELVRLLPVTSVQSGEFDYKIYERVVRNTTNRSPREFKEMQRRELIANRVRDLVRARVRVPESEAWMQFERERSKAVIRVVQIRRDWMSKYALDTSDKAVDAWAEENKEQVDEAWKAEKESFTADCPLVRGITVSFPPGAGDEEKTALRDKIERAKQKLGEGQDFGQVAREMSEADSAVVGGRMGCLAKDADEQLREGVKDLAKGGVTPVLETPSGFHLLKLEAKVKEKDLEKLGRRYVARKLYTRFQGAQLAQKFADELLERAKGAASLTEATDALAREYAEAFAKTGKGDELPALQSENRPKVEISSPFTASGMPITNAAPFANVAAKAFELEKPDAFLAQPVATRDGFAVVQLKEKEPASREEFEKDKTAIMRSLRQAKQSQALVKYVERLKNGAKDEMKLAVELVQPQKDDENSGDQQ